jgi:hypothetical protein
MEKIQILKKRQITRTFNLGHGGEGFLITLLAEDLMEQQTKKFRVTLTNLETLSVHQERPWSKTDLLLIQDALDKMTQEIIAQSGLPASLLG